MNRLRRLGLLVCAVLIAMLADANHLNAAGPCALYRTWQDGDTVTGADLTNSFITVGQTNMVASCVDDFSSTDTQMQSSVDPYPASAESLATTLEGEIQRLRYQLRALITGPNAGETGFHWYIDPIVGTRGNLLVNGSVEKWGAGIAVAPSNWTLTGASATTARNSTASQFKLGSYSADVVRVGFDAYLGQIVTTPQVLPAWNADYIDSRNYTLAAWVRATVASRCRVGINDGVATTWSDYHTGGSTFELLTATRTLSASATALEARLGVDTGDTTCQFDGVILVEGYLNPTFTPHPTDHVTYARVYNSLNISITDAVATALTFDSERKDTSDFHSTVSNTSRLTVPVAGWCQVTGSIQWAALVQGDRRRVSIRLNGTTTLAAAIDTNDSEGTSYPAEVIDLSVSTGYYFAAGDYVELVAFQDSTGSLNVLATGNTSPEFSIHCLAP